MKNHIKFLTALFSLVPAYVFGDKEGATFDAIFIPDFSIPWWGWLVIILSTVIAAVVVYFSAGTATGPVAAVGTAIGNAMGLTGAAATSAGLALLGGGSIAAGGLGMAGGAALLTAAFSFGTELITEYTINYAMREYSIQKLESRSENMIILPPSQLTGRTDAIKRVGKILEDIDPERDMNRDYNQAVFAKAYSEVENEKTAGLKDIEKLETYTVQAVLLHQLGKHKSSKEKSLKAIKVARHLELRRTVPAFLVALATLHEEEFSGYDVFMNKFGYSVLAEPDNPLVPLMFSMFTDLALYRFHERGVSSENLKQLVSLAGDESLGKDTRGATLLIVGGQLLVNLKMCQQDILAITKNTQPEILGSSRVEKVLEERLDSYQRLLRVLRQEFMKQVTNNTETLKKYAEDLPENVDKNDLEILSYKGLNRLLDGYSNEFPSLKNSVDEFNAARANYLAGLSEEQEPEGGFPLWLLGILIVATGFYLSKRFLVSSVQVTDE